ncbi:cobalt-precorrin 5A hydrolase [Konateibacter massiliensis]|uniref:cobalt-precorrin 5A hydrolase n=1 Tax=Konateibacter massiliensis TaxID=2002841 RepID=UPI000C160040|nr:cobalt-precorrin 5A hydrolase [Konateibacter massiliensis]
MKLAIVSFTKAGSILNDKMVRLLEPAHSCMGYYKGRCEAGVELTKIEEDLQDWCERQFADMDGIIFIGACGIAVRTIAPFVKDKTKDPLVLVIDEGASFVISLLSGHIGGGNELTLEISRLLQATPVITTATDINGRFAVDVFAKREGLFITDMKMAKEVSAAVLEGQRIGLSTRLQIEGEIPKELVLPPVSDVVMPFDVFELNLANDDENTIDTGICISYDEEKPFTNTLNLIPKRFILGIGCKKNIESKKLEEFLLNLLQEVQISVHAIKTIASIDLKVDEACIRAFSDKYEIPFVTYTAEELKAVEGDFQESDFVKQVTGVGSVCERSAIKACRKPATLFMRKRAYEGMTAALAIEEETRGIRFE